MINSLLLLATLCTLQLVYSEEMKHSHCYGELGCLSISKKWYSIQYRTMNLLPYARSTINTRFILRNNQMLRSDTPSVVVKYNEHNGEAVSSRFNPNLKTTFIVHGFMDRGTSAWLSQLAANLIQAENRNVFQVNWGMGSLPPYTQATANTRLVGLEIAHFIKSLINDHGASVEDIHIIGHSLGAHIAGYAGEALNGTLGRITGLDPAGPNFEGMPEFVRLDPSDAVYVDAIHTDGESLLQMGFGIYEPVGHQDFYVNGGHDQPGCHIHQSAYKILSGDITGSLLDFTGSVGSSGGRAGQTFMCSHMRSVDIYTESVLSPCRFLSKECSSYDDIEAGTCGQCTEESTDCVSMGFHAHIPQDDTRTLVKYYTHASGNKPYCVPTEGESRIESGIEAGGLLACGLEYCTSTQYCSAVHLNFSKILTKMCHDKQEAGDRCTRDKQCRSGNCSIFFKCK